MSNNTATCIDHKNNLLYPMLRQTPCFGEGLRPYADGVVSTAYETYRKSKGRLITVLVDWGTFQMECGNNASLTIHGLGRNPAYQLLAQKEWSPAKDLLVSWETASCIYPEYLATLRVYKDNDNKSKACLQRTLHVLPPPDTIDYHLGDILWAPGLQNNSGRNQKPNVITNGHTHPAIRSKRGFGLELETVQLPPASESDYFTHQAILEAAIDSRTCNKELHDRLKLWKVEQDLQVENSAPWARWDLWKRLQKELASHQSNNSLRSLILGGRPPEEEMAGWPEGDIPTSLSSPEYKSPAPPKELYHTFPPTAEDEADQEIRFFLDHVLKNCTDRAIICPTVSLRGHSASSIHVHVNVCHPQAHPTIVSHSDLQLTRSLASVVLNWIRFDSVTRQFSAFWMWREPDLMALHAQGPECVYTDVAWKQGTTTCATIPEHWNVPTFFERLYLAYREATSTGMPVKNQGKNETKNESTSPTTGSSSSSESADELEDDNNDYGSFLFGSNDTEASSSDDIEKNEMEDSNNSPLKSYPILQSVFEDSLVRTTLGRKCSLNLLALQKYGTVEIRRFHATLNADVVTAWTRFCVGFVEHFARPENQQFANQCLDEAGDSQTGLERLIQGQNHATLEELMAILSCGDTSTVLPSTFATLLEGANVESEQ